ncbi:MAG: TIGR00730 family Rossman fold protein [Kangiellaceae bacterium]|nr:TIGR00730 family Rossman fold protein [Kangiellaceae bacterium]MCW9000691.1 TIGR00730 family Rossman fold protein [Kangiellaceae bacterium]
MSNQPPGDHNSTKHSQHQSIAELEADAQENQIQAERLSQEWLKVEKALDKAGILRTIVFFGSARIEDHRAAELMQEKADQLSVNNQDNELAQLAQNNAKLTKNQSLYYECARELARLLGKHLYECNDLHTKLVTGGGPGIMEAANRGAAEIGQQSIGLNITIPSEQKPNPYIAESLSFQFRYFSLRKMHFLKRAVAIVVFPGGFGTLDELLEVLTLMQTGKIDKIPIILFGQNFWSRVVDFSFLAEQQLIDEEDLNLYTIVDDVKLARNLLIQCLECTT